MTWHNEHEVLSGPGHDSPSRGRSRGKKAPEVTPSQLERMTKLFQDYAKEAVTVEVITGQYYVFGSELAILRILAKYRTLSADMCSHGYSEHLSQFYFRLNVMSGDA